MSNVIIFIFTWLYLCSHLHVSPVTLFFTWFYLCSHLHVSPVHFFFYLALPLLSPACVTCLLSFLPGFTCTFTCMCHLFTFCFYLVLPLLLPACVTCFLSFFYLDLLVLSPACVTCLLSFFTWLYLCFYLHVSPVYFLFLPGFTMWYFLFF
jgi:hypothetical protein